MKNGAMPRRRSRNLLPTCLFCFHSPRRAARPARRCAKQARAIARHARANDATAQRTTTVLYPKEWDYNLPAFAATVESARLVSESAFAEWYPAWHDADVSGTLYREEDMKFLLANVRIENLGGARIYPEYPILRSPLFHGDNSKLNAGIFVDQYAESAVYPLYAKEKQANPDEYFNPDANLNMVGPDTGALCVDPGETKTLTYPFIIYRNSFNGCDAIDSLAIGDFALAYLDYHPWSIIELELA